MAGDSVRGISAATSGDTVFQLQQPDLRAVLCAFARSGRIDKKTAESLYSFCRHERGPWIHPDNNDNNAAPLTSPASPPSDSPPGMSTSSSTSSQNPPTRQQTPTSDHDHAYLSQQYRLDPPQADYVELKTFLLRLLYPAAFNGMVDRRKIQELFNMSSMPGSGTQAGFENLLEEAAAPLNLKSIIGHSWTGSSVLQHHSPPFQAQHPLQAQDKAFRAHQQSHSSDYFYHDFNPQVPNLGLPPQLLPAQMQHPHMLPAFEELRDHSHAQAALGQAQVGNRAAASFGPPQISSQQGNYNSPGSPTANLHTSPPNKTRRVSRQKEGMSITSTADAPPKASAPKPSKNSASKCDDKKQPEVSKRVVVYCKLLDKDGKRCSESCSSEDARNARGDACKFMIEHIHRVHPKHYIPNLPSDQKSLNKMFNLQVAACIIKLANEQPCTWTLIGDKAYKTGLDHIREHHSHKFNEKLEKFLGSAKAAFEAMVHDHEIKQCPLNKKGTSERCPKACAGDQLYRSLIEHIRRAHCEHHYKKEYVEPIKQMRPDLATNESLKSNVETMKLICQRYWAFEKSIQAPAMELSASSHSASSSYSAGSSLHQQRHASQDAPMHSPSTPAPPMNNLPPQHIQQFHHAAMQYSPNGPQCVPPAALQMSPTGQMGQMGYMGHMGHMGHMGQMSQPDMIYHGFMPGAEPSLFNAQGADGPLTQRFSPNSRVRGRDRQQMVSGMAMPGSAQETLRPPLFSGHDVDMTGSQQHMQMASVQPAALRQTQHNGYHHQLPLGQMALGEQQTVQQTVQGMADNSSPLVEKGLNGGSQASDLFSRKRERDELDGVDGNQGSPSKKVSTWAHEQYGLPFMGDHLMPAAPLQSSNDPNLGGIGSFIGLTSGESGILGYEHGEPIGAPVPVDDAGSGGGRSSFPEFDLDFINSGNGDQNDSGDAEYANFFDTDP